MSSRDESKRDHESSRVKRKINCYGNRSTSDVVISLVRSAAPVLVDEKPAAGEMILPSLSSAHDKGKGPAKELESTAECLTRKRKRGAEEENKEDSKETQETTLAEFYVHKERLRRSSRYFEACLSERWSGGETSDGVQSSRRVSLEAYVPVKYYEACIRHMYVPRLGDVSIRWCLNVVQAALQIDYQELVQECMDYLAAIEWIHADDKKWMVRWCSSGSYFARQRLLLTTTFERVMEWPCHTVAEVYLGFFNNKIKKEISNAVEIAKLRSECGEFPMDLLSTERYMLQLLLHIERAKEVVEYIIEESDLPEALKTKQISPWEMDWALLIVRIMRDVIEGRLVLGSSTRHKLITNYTWLLVLGYEYGMARETAEIFCKFTMTFPREEQLKLLNLEDLRRSGAIYFESNEMWIKGLEYKICSLEKQTKYCVEFLKGSQSFPGSSSVSDASGDSRLSEDGSFHSPEFNCIDGAHPDAGWPEVEVTSSHLG